MESKKNRLRNRLSFLGQIALSVFIIVYICIAPFSILPSLLYAQAEVNRAESYEYQGILELWHVETFEGGSQSRSGFLEREAINFEKMHKGTYIVIQTMSLEQFSLNITSGKNPNIISFGIGVGNNFVERLIDLDCENIRTDLCVGGRCNGKQKAIPYILGGYANISVGGGDVGVGLAGSTNPLRALQKNKKQIASIYKDVEIDSYTAYDKFIKGSFKTLIGTQRDVYRCKSRMDKGLLSEVNFDYLGGYTDLVQYLSIFKSNAIEEKLCRQFVSHIISADVQRKLKEYSLFSTLNNLKLYNDGIYNDFENCLQNTLEVENVFLDLQQINEQKIEAFSNVVKK